jgi:hypothetical protein
MAALELIIGAAWPAGSGRFDSFTPSMLRCPFTGPRDLRWLIHTRERGPKAQERLLNAAATTHAEMANSRFTTSSDH